MKQWVFSALIGLIALSFTIDAEAQRRLGMGRTFGRPAPQVQRQAAPPPQQATPATPQTPPQAQTAGAPRQPGPGMATPPASPWRGALMGLAAGLGLAALANWLGLGEGFATIMTIALLVFLALTLLGAITRRRAPPPQPAYPYGRAGTMTSYPPQPAEAMPRPIEHRFDPMAERGFDPVPAARPGSAMAEFGRAAAPFDEPWGIPAGFDTAGFLAQAKAHFARLQQAWGDGSLAQLEEFTTTEMFTALTHDLHARRGASQPQVVTLDAKLLGIETNAADHLASVRFTGTMRLDGELEQFDEVWNLVKPTDGKTGWLLAGIQQLS
jgi:predicted lipid-binding transport protein (Tim44 family)